ncbi:protein POLAR-like 1 isoform X1 [Rosa rugosa]|uniref:protein POLAR-like 1 isoform X1 n=1 Tax=Rosa rugosa TaxID=74645 RepID=UPI002B40C789|nr:protein POLAR-like 1 isoform X1 [Rosa rugosa]
MWPALFAAAVAASTGLLAKNHLFKPAAEITDSDPQNDAVSDDATPQRSVASVSRSPMLPWESDCEDQVKEGIFRFSSDGGSGKKKKKKTRFCLKKKDVVEEQKKKSGRRVGVCLKKRKTVASKCGSSSDSKDTSSLFSWGLNIGIMYMMTAGKAEINKLNTTMDETAKVVQELKSELNKRKASQSQQVSCSESEANTQVQSPSCKRTQTELKKSSAENSEPNYMRASSFHIFDDGECPSSVLTEEQEPEPEVMDMDQLEAELESELQKLPWCSTEAPHQEGFRNLGKDIVSEVSAQKFQGQAAQGIDIEQFQGVLPAELDQKLCHVLIEQQESQIVELESNLQSAQSKLQEKETELQALKDCVKRLTQLSLSTVSDDENEAHNEQEQITGWNYNTERSESIKPVVGMKRPIDSES